MNIEEANKVFTSCNRPSTLKVVCTFPDGEEHHFPLDLDYDEMFMEWLTNGSNEHPIEYWQKYWRTGKISKQDINEQNTFVMGFLEALHQSDKCPPRMMEEEYEVRVEKNIKPCDGTCGVKTCTGIIPCHTCGQLTFHQFGSGHCIKCENFGFGAEKLEIRKR
jgi:hypothetical protein